MKKDMQQKKYVNSLNLPIFLTLNYVKNFSYSFFKNANELFILKF